MILMNFLRKKKIKNNFMEKNTIKKILNCLFPEIDINVVTIDVVTKEKLNEDKEVGKDIPIYFVGVCVKGYPSKLPKISEIVSIFTGLEFNFFRV